MMKVNFRNIFAICMDQEKITQLDEKITQFHNNIKNLVIKPQEIYELAIDLDVKDYQKHKLMYKEYKDCSEESIDLFNSKNVPFLNFKNQILNLNLQIMKIFSSFYFENTKKSLELAFNKFSQHMENFESNSKTINQLYNDLLEIQKIIKNAVQNINDETLLISNFLFLQYIIWCFELIEKIYLKIEELDKSKKSEFSIYKNEKPHQNSNLSITIIFLIFNIIIIGIFIFMVYNLFL